LATEEDNTIHCPADVSNDNTMDLDEEYINVEDPQPSQDTPENK